ncbi:hypothetical protein ACROYT_G005851 [Oculina patagonica]
MLNNSYFTYEGVYYHQVFGCAMGSLVSAVIADLVMSNIEERALSTFPVAPKWWRRKKNHTNKYLDFASHNPMQHKEAVVKTLLNRANMLPPNPDLKSSEQDRVIKDLRANGYLTSCLRNT